MSPTKYGSVSPVAAVATKNGGVFVVEVMLKARTEERISPSVTRMLTL